MQTTSLTIGTSTIRQHDELFSLNDLHKASGGLETHKPKFWLANKQTQELAAEIQKGGILPFTVQRGANGGTYACRELVIAYAAWISAAFHLKVIRVFLDHTDSPRSSFNTPAADQSKVSRLKLHVLDIHPRPNGRRCLSIRCGDVGFGVTVPPDFKTKIGDCLIAEYPKEDNPLATRSTAMYPECLQPVTRVTPDWDWTTIGSHGLAALAAKCAQELAQRLGA